MRAGPELDRSDESRPRDPSILVMTADSTSTQMASRVAIKQQTAGAAFSRQHDKVNLEDWPVTCHTGGSSKPITVYTIRQPIMEESTQNVHWVEDHRRQV